MKLLIKKEIDLDKLEKFGFIHLPFVRKYRYSTEDGAVICVNKNTRVISISKLLDDDVYDLSILFELFKANLVEIEEEK